MTRWLFLLGLFFISSCTLKTEKVIEKTQSLDLLTLEEKGYLSSTEIIAVTDDPVYHKPKEYNAVPLIPLLKRHTFADSLDTSKMKVVFECEDGYKPEMSLTKLLNSQAFLATSDVDAPPGSKWEQIIKDGTEMKAAPFYVIYKGVSAKDYSYKWPYNLVKIHFEPLEVAEIPQAIQHSQGRKLYIQHCKVCHALNGAGGNMGPELNRPKSITSYWKENHLVAFIQNPQAYRENVKMPNLDLSAHDSKEIVYYLKEIAEEPIL